MATKIFSTDNGSLHTFNELKDGLNTSLEGKDFHLKYRNGRFFDANRSAYLTNAFYNLVSQAQVVGSDIPVTNTSVGNRKSAFVDDEDRNTTNCPEVPGEWNSVAAGYSVVDYTVTAASIAMGDKCQHVTTADPSTSWNASCKVTLISGDPTGFRMGLVTSLGWNVDSVNLDYMQIGDVLEIDTSGTLGVSSTQARISLQRYTSNGSGTAVFKIEESRLTNGLYQVTPFPQGVPAGYTKTDQITKGGIPMVFSGAGQTNLVSSDLTEWTTAASVPGEEPVIAAVGDNEFTITIEDTTNISVATYSFAAASADRTCACKMRIDEGMETIGASDQLVFRSATTVKGTAYTFDNITEDYEDATCKVTSADSTNQLAFRFTAVIGKVVICVKLMRAYDFSAAAPACVDGSGAGKTFGTDLLGCRPTWPSAGTIVQLGTAYDWSTGSHPASEFARLFAVARLEGWVNGASLVGSGGTPVVATGGTITAATPFVFSSDWNGSEIGARFDEISRTTALESDTPSGIFYVGNRTDTTRPFHGALVTLLFDRVLTDEEYEIVRQGLLNIFSDVEFQ